MTPSLAPTLRPKPPRDLLAPTFAVLRWGVPILVTVLGTGGCGVLAMRVAAAVTSTAERVVAIEVKLDAWREEQHRLTARADVADRDDGARESNDRARDSRIDSLTRDLARCRCPLEVARSEDR